MLKSFRKTNEHVAMDELCRLCLNVSAEMACKLCDQSKIFSLLTCVNIQLSTNDSFPSSVCQVCLKIIDSFQNFVENVKQNEAKLINFFNKGNNFDTLCQNLKSSSIENIKTEAENDGDNKFSEEQIDFEHQIESQNNVQYKPEPDLKDMPQISSTEDNVTDENKNTDMANSRKNKSKSEVKIKVKIGSKFIAAQNSRKLKNLAKLELPIEMENHLSQIENSSTIAKITSDFGNMKNKCLTCFEYFVTHSALINHYKTVHVIYNKTVLEELNKSKSIINNSKDFLKSKTGNDPSENMDNGTSLKPERIYNCKICGHTFTNVYGIIRHGRTHWSQTMYCSHGCGYSTVYNGALKDHEKRHENNYKYKCDTCGAGFHVKTWHDQHQNIHKNVKPFVCDVCGMAFHMHRYLTSHRTSVHPDVSKGSKKYICPHCDIAFFNIHNYRTHLEEHTGKKRYLCDLCGKVCTSAEQLKYHNNAHLGVKPHTCSICNKKFAKKSTLTVHEKAHSGEKHLCQTCGKHFAQRSTLLRHGRRHHPEVAVQNIRPRTEGVLMC